MTSSALRFVTYSATFERYGDQAGSPIMGFIRTPQPEARLAIDPVEMVQVVELFTRYSRGDVSYRILALESGVPEGALRATVTNPLNNGWAVRNRRSPDERRIPAPWRNNPPVSDELWQGSRGTAADPPLGKNSGDP